MSLSWIITIEGRDYNRIEVENLTDLKIIEKHIKKIKNYLKKQEKKND